MTSVKDEMEEVTSNATALPESKSTETGLGKLAININNSAESTMLQIDSLKMCNIQNTQEARNIPIGAATPIKLEYGSEFQSPPIVLPEQTITPWAPPALPENSTGSYLKIYGALYAYITDGQPFLLYEGAMYTALYGRITAENTKEIRIILSDNCPVYCISDGTPEKILKSINFAPHVVEWK